MEAFFDKYFGTEDRFKQTFWHFSQTTKEDFDAFFESEVTKNAKNELKEKVDGYIDNRFKENVKDDVLQFMIGNQDVQASLDQLRQNLAVLTDETFDVFKGRLNTHLNETLAGNSVLNPIYTRLDNLESQFIPKTNSLMERVTTLEVQNNSLRDDINVAYAIGTISLGILWFYPLFSRSIHISY